ncbi:MAG: histidinol-phosphate transaminase [Bacteroidetes bacterium RIFCSPLOWO2_12_FULL_37_12]|nr:MAG: histidinol-phosphate transaminase [Bacteroidetes bacterium RIFCSPLOWO2_12_FULL_37_12]
MIRLNANENFYGCSGKVISAMRKKLKDVNFYPDFNPISLENELAGKLNVTRENIVIGAGSVRIIDGIIQTFCANQNDEIITFENSFSAYHQLAGAYNRKYIFAKQENFICRLKNIFPLLNKNTKVIFLANPNNPTGTIITHDELNEFMKRLPSPVLMVVDEAYCEYVCDTRFPDSVSLLKKYPNLIIARTFSKAYGLAGLRIGYAIAHKKNIHNLKKTRIPYSINYLSETAAKVALSDRAFIKKCCADNDKERKILFDSLVKSGYNALESQANFIYVYFASEEEKEIIFKKLFDSNILVCNMKIFEQEKCLRIGVGDRKTNKMILKCLTSPQPLSKMERGEK